VIEPSLKHYSEFKEILSSYQVSSHARDVLNGLKLVLLLAPTSAGKNTIIRHQIATGRYYNLISDTTRPPRVNDGVQEQDGVEYWFRTEEQMLADLRAGGFLEAEIIHGQQVSGISIRELEKAKAANQIAITDVDPEGVRNILQAKPDTLAVMLVPPNYDEWQRRLASRGKMRPDERRRRLETAAKIFADGLKQDSYHFVISENVEQSSSIIDAIVEGKANPHQGRARDIIQQLQSRLRDELGDTY